LAKVLYFAALRDLAGVPEEERAIPSEVRTVRELVVYLQQVRPELAGKMASVRVALDEEFAKDDALVAHVSVIALIPPVSGG
jgi:molybdopterin synthase sulfur carrier subunit